MLCSRFSEGFTFSLMYNFWFTIISTPTKVSTLKVVPNCWCRLWISLWKCLILSVIYLPHSSHHTFYFYFHVHLNLNENFYLRYVYINYINYNNIALMSLEFLLIYNELVWKLFCNINHKHYNLQFLFIREKIVYLKIFQKFGEKIFLIFFTWRFKVRKFVREKSKKCFPIMNFNVVPSLWLLYFIKM